MQEIAEQFKEELQELLNRYKDHLTTPQIMRIAQPVFAKTIGFRDNPERFKGFSYAKGFPIVDELDHYSTHKLIDINGLKVPAELIEKPNPEFKKMMQGEPKCTD